MRTLTWLRPLMLLATFSLSAWSMGGGMGGGMSGGMGGAQRAKKKSEFKKWELPAAAEAAAPDTSAFDACAGELGLAEAQRQSLVQAKAELLKEAERLRKEQAEARAAYEKIPADDEPAARVAVPKVLAAAQACKAFEPRRKWDQALNEALSAAQWSQYQKAKAQDRRAANAPGQE